MAYAGGSNVILEKGDKICKFPTSKIRPLKVTAVPNDSSDTSIQEPSSSINFNNLINERHLPRVVKNVNPKTTITDEIWNIMDISFLESRSIAKWPEPIHESHNVFFFC